MLYKYTFLLPIDRPFSLTPVPSHLVGISGMGNIKIIKHFNLQIVKKSRGDKTRMGDGYAYILNVFYWRGDGKTMFSWNRSIRRFHRESTSQWAHLLTKATLLHKSLAIGECCSTVGLGNSIARQHHHATCLVFSLTKFMLINVHWNAKPEIKRQPVSWHNS